MLCWDFQLWEILSFHRVRKMEKEFPTISNPSGRDFFQNLPKSSKKSLSGFSKVSEWFGLLKITQFESWFNPKISGVQD